MYQSTKEIAKEIDCTVSSVNQYLCRSEFAHIPMIYKRNTYYYKDMTNDDKEKLKNLINNAKKRIGRK